MLKRQELLTMYCFTKEVLFCFIVFIVTSPTTSFKQNACTSLPTSCSVMSHYSRMMVDVHCEDQLPDFSCIDFPHAPIIYELGLSKCTFERVQKQFFQKLVGLQQLHMHCNKVAPELQFEEGVFQLPNLRNIRITGNVIKNLPPDVFCHIPKLEKLYLHNNSIASSEILGFGTNCSSTCTLTILKLSDNFLTHVPSLAFCSLKNLIYLDLSRNMIRSIDEDALFNLGSLRVLDLSFNKLISIPETTLKPLTGLYNLDLDGNLNLNITGCFKYVPHLKGLFLPGIGLEYIEKDAFQGMDRVESLMLYGNKLHDLDEDVFEPLIGVVDDLTNVTAPAECEEDAIKRLVFGGDVSFLNKKQAEVVNVTGLRYLNLNENNFTVIPPIRKLFKLLVLSMSRNNIEILDDDNFNNLIKLQRLVLSSNRIPYISHRIFANLKCLKQLLLDHNAISDINSEAFHDLTTLSEVSLQHNRIKDIRGVFINNDNLKVLNLSNNYLEELSLENLPSSIVQLDVSHNFIKQLVYIPASLPKQVRMELLDLSNNKISHISKSFFPTALTQLFLHKNIIRSISNCIFCSLGTIVNVTLHDNQLQTIRPEDLRIHSLPVFEKTPSVSLNGNNFICNCELQDLLNFVDMYSQSYLKIENLESLPCHREYSRNQPSVIQIVQANPPEDFLCRINNQSNAFLLGACSIYRNFNWEYVIVDCTKLNLTLIPPEILPGIRKLYFDGNNLAILQNSTFKSQVHRNLIELHLNDSHVEVIEDGTFIELINLTHLYLQNNRLKILSTSTFAGLNHLSVLFLSNNNLILMEEWTFCSLSNLREVQLNNNRLRSFPVWNLNTSKSLSTISLSQNRWSCDCDFVQKFRTWLQNSASEVVDIDSLFCKSDDYSTFEVPLIAFNLSHCYPLTEPSFLESKYFSLTIGLITSLALFTTTCIILFIYRKEMQVLIYSRYGIRMFHKNDLQNVDRQKVFDAFLCYSNHDEDFAVDELVPKLEGIDPPFRLCIHQREFLVGSFITDNILEAVSKSKRTILVLTEAFVASEWCRFEFKTAYVQMLNDKCNHVIVIVVGDVPKKLDPEMKLYLKTNTYISWSDKLFWERLYFAMPDRVRTEEIANDDL